MGLNQPLIQLELYKSSPHWPKNISIKLLQMSDKFWILIRIQDFLLKISVILYKKILFK